jgi:hypothetical protein
VDTLAARGIDSAILATSRARGRVEVTAAKAMLASGTMTAAEVARGRVQRQNVWAVTAQ